MGNIQSNLRTIIYSIFALIIGFVLIRLLLKIIGANPDNQFAEFWYTFTDIFVEPWAMIYPNVISGGMIIEVYSVVAILFYIIISIVVTKSASSPFEDSRKLAIAELVDSMFKVVEFLLITRFIFKITAASTSAPFVRIIYDLSWIVYEPFATLIPAVEFQGAKFEISTLAALIIVIILDMVTEQLVFSILDTFFPDRERVKKKSYPQTYPQQQAPLQPAQQPQNININMPPQQQAPPTYVDRRTIQVLPSQGQKPQKRGFLQKPGKPRSSRQGGPPNS